MGGNINIIINSYRSILEFKNNILKFLHFFFEEERQHFFLSKLQFKPKPNCVV